MLCPNCVSKASEEWKEKQLRMIHISLLRFFPDTTTSYRNQCAEEVLKALEKNLRIYHD